MMKIIVCCSPSTPALIHVCPMKTHEDNTRTTRGQHELHPHRAESPDESVQSMKNGCLLFSVCKNLHRSDRHITHMQANDCWYESAYISNISHQSKDAVVYGDRHTDHCFNFLSAQNISHRIQLNWGKPGLALTNVFLLIHLWSEARTHLGLPLSQQLLVALLCSQWTLNLQVIRSGSTAMLTDHICASDIMLLGDWDSVMSLLCMQKR